MDLSELKATDVFKPEFVPQYLDIMKNYYFPQIVRLNNNLFIVEQILNFPLSLFVGSYQEAPFLFLVRENFLDMSVIIVNRLLNDDTNRSYTLRTFKNAVVDNTLPEYKQTILDRLKPIDLKSIEGQLGKIRIIRNDRLAHAAIDYSRPLEPTETLSIPEIQNLRDMMNNLIDALSFETHYSKVYMSYDPNTSSMADADIVTILDNIVRDSPLLRAPEQQPDYWPYHRKRLTEEDMRQLNHYRYKFRLPPVL